LLVLDVVLLLVVVFDVVCRVPVFSGTAAVADPCDGFIAVTCAEDTGATFTPGVTGASVVSGLS